MSRDIEWTFRAGVKYGPGGNRSLPEKCKESRSSNGLTKYITILWDDGVLTCDCRGWAIKKPGQPRNCKHCKASVASAFNDMEPVNAFRQEPVANLPEGRQPRFIRIRDN